MFSGPNRYFWLSYCPSGCLSCCTSQSFVKLPRRACLRGWKRSAPSPNSQKFIHLLYRHPNAQKIEHWPQNIRKNTGNRLQSSGIEPEPAAWKAAILTTWILLELARYSESYIGTYLDHDCLLKGDWLWAGASELYILTTQSRLESLWNDQRKIGWCGEGRSRLGLEVENPNPVARFIPNLRHKTLRQQP